jgi:hypothetical protein
MPMYVDLASEAALSTIVGTTLLDATKRNIGFDPETPTELLPVDLEDLLHECISICEKEQWRFILRKPVTLTLPYEAFCNPDGLFFLPFGRVTEITTFTYIKSDLTTGTITSSDYTLYTSEPSKLWAENWEEVFEEINDEQPYPITITYTTGYASYDAVPKSTIRAIKILAYHLFEYRDAISDGSVSELPQGYCQLRDLNLLNDHRAIRYITEDWSKVSRG